MAELPRHVVLFDGVCVFCDGAVRWLMARDPEERLRFAPLQGETAAALRARHPQIPEALETMVLVEGPPGDQRVYTDSEAVFRTLALLQSPWRHLAWLRVLPRGLTDAGYRLFARLRYRLFGRRDSCAIPTPAEAARFLS
ncbi:MAG: thiol-disulfide oxidoreductase DCC family protein [Myxococcota bacterium]